MHEPSAATGLALVRLHASDGRSSREEIALNVGDLIGRHANCGLALHYPGAPLVAACVVRRGRRIFLEGQGMRPELGSQQARRIRLSTGVFVPFGPLTLEVVRVQRPQRVMAVSLGDFPLQELVAPYYALRGGRAPDLLPGEIPRPDAEIVHVGRGWRISVAGGPFEDLGDGRVWHPGGTTLRSAWVDTRSPAISMCVEPLTIEAGDRSELVQIRRSRRHRVTLRGRPALLLRSAARSERPINPALFDSREAFQAALEDLADALRAHGLRDDLVRDDGMGGFELYLHREDRLEYVRASDAR